MSYVRVADHLPEIPEDGRRCEYLIGDPPDDSLCALLEDEHWTDPEPVGEFIEKVVDAHLKEVFA